MEYKRILTVQDISCVGQCSLTVALPILSACGVETCILPSAVLSSHTGGFQEVFVRDMTPDIPEICRCWEKEGLQFDAVYTGYLGSAKQMEYAGEIFESMTRGGSLKIVDPAMADHGKLYRGFDDEYAEKMGMLCSRADIILPNLTEACMLAGQAYDPDLPEDKLRKLMEKLQKLGPKCVVVTGAVTQPGQTGVAILEGGQFWKYVHPKEKKNCHGTGDIFASAFIGSCLSGKTRQEAAVIAADYTRACIHLTLEDSTHWYGARFEPLLPKLMRMLRGQ